MKYINCNRWSPNDTNSVGTKIQNFLRRIMGNLNPQQDGLMNCGKCQITAGTTATKWARCSMCGTRNIV